MKRHGAGAIVRIVTFVSYVTFIVQSQGTIFAQAGPIVVGQSTQAGQPIPVPSTSQLDSLVAPIALYPDPLLSQVLVASTYPLEVVQAAQWLQQNTQLTGVALQNAARTQNWDPSVQALVVFPDVLRRLSENIQWTTDLGNAFLADQAAVMDAVQRMRSQALASGNLTSNVQTAVTARPQGNATLVEIQPANPQVIYVPVYDPLAVWGPPAFYPYPVLRYPRTNIILGGGFVSFAPGVFVGSAFWGWSGWSGWGWRPDWYGRTIVVNNNFLYRYGYNRVAFGGVRTLGGTATWTHDAVHRWRVPYANREVATRFHSDFAGSRSNRPQTVIRSAAPGYLPNASRPAVRRFAPGSSVPDVTTPAINRPGPSRVAPSNFNRDRGINQDRGISRVPDRGFAAPREASRMHPNAGGQAPGHFRHEGSSGRPSHGGQRSHQGRR
jgi:hypothetical protein